MTCKYCGGELGPEDVRCPHCNRKNTCRGASGKHETLSGSLRGDQGTGAKENHCVSDQDSLDSYGGTSVWRIPFMMPPI